MKSHGRPELREPTRSRLGLRWVSEQGNSGMMTHGRPNLRLVSELGRDGMMTHRRPDSRSASESGKGLR